MTRRQQRPASRVVGDWLLNILALAGSVCIVLVILGVVFNVSIMMFRTGSMSPTITAGSIALVREIPATEVDEGDVVTVERGEGTLPVTHRVVRILETDSSSGVVTFEMRGDANEAKDPKPYAESTVSRVMFSVPGVAPVIQWFSNPYVLGGLTLGATTLVVWAFWPRKGESDDDRDEVTDAHRAQSLVAAGRTGPRHAAAGLATALMLAALAGTAALTSGPQGPGTTEGPAAHGEYLRMTSYGDTEKMRSLGPGLSATWIVDVWADAPEPGDVRLDLSADGTLSSIPDAVNITVEMCPQRVDWPQCTDGSTTLLEDVSLSALPKDHDPAQTLATMSTDEERRLFVTATLSDSASQMNLGGETGTVRVYATGAGEELSLSPDEPRPDDDGTLPRTGIAGWQWLLLTGGLLILVGVTLVTRQRKEVQR